MRREWLQRVVSSPSRRVYVDSSMNDGSNTQMAAPACVAHAISVGAVWDADVGFRSVFGCSEATAPEKVKAYSTVPKGSRSVVRISGSRTPITIASSAIASPDSDAQGRRVCGGFELKFNPGADNDKNASRGYRRQWIHRATHVD